MENKTSTHMDNQQSNVIGIQVNKMLRYASNPYTSNIPTKSKRSYLEVKNRDMTVIQQKDDGGAIVEVTQMCTHHKVDTQTFLKLYDDGVSMMLDLNRAGKEVFRHVAAEIRQNMNSDRIYLSHSMLQGKGRDISQPTYARGIRELIDKKMIAPVLNQVNLWWINPNFIFNGDRLQITASYERVDETTGEMTNANQA
jgi:hypothetical protein